MGRASDHYEDHLNRLNTATWEREVFLQRLAEVANVLRVPIAAVPQAIADLAASIRRSEHEQDQLTAILLGPQPEDFDIVPMEVEGPGPVRHMVIIEASYTSFQADPEENRAARAAEARARVVQLQKDAEEIVRRWAKPRLTVWQRMRAWLAGKTPP